MFHAIDMHCDTIYEIFERGLDAEAFRSNSELHIDAERLQQAGYACQCLALYSCPDAYQKHEMRPFEYFKAMSDTFDRCVAANSDIIRPVLRGSDIEKNMQDGVVSALKTVEEGMVYEGDVEKLKEAYELGVRMSTLTWNFENELGYPNPSTYNPVRGGYWCVDTDTVNGLKPKGFEFVQAMEDMGMIIDISHLNDAGIADVFRTVKASTPVIASHSNARACCMHPRNLSDEMLRQIADHGGVAGINFCPLFLNEEAQKAQRPEEAFSRIEDMLRHMKYMKNVAGIDTLALGSDFDGIEGNLEIKGASSMGLLADAMSRAGFTDGEIEKVFFGNAIRVFKDVLDSSH